MSKIITQTGYWEDKTNNMYHVCSEPLCNWIINWFSDQKDKQVYDFGCGLGHYLTRFKAAGFTKLTGFEGSLPINKQFDNIIIQDLALPFTVPGKGNVIFLEVAEHVPAQFENTLLDNVSNACDDKLVMSWAVRGQPGEGHVNCLDNHEAIERVVKRGFTYLPEETQAARDTIVNEFMWFKNTTLVFKR